MNIIPTSKRIVRYAAYFIAALVLLTHVSHGLVRAASFNPEINYQGKLADNTGSAVSDDGYNMRFKLFTVGTGGAEIWSETLCYSTDNGDSCAGSGTDSRVDVTSGLFSVLLGNVSTTSLASINFNQNLWLEVAIGGTSTTPSWETLSPRKKLGTVPSAFQADQLDGLDSLQFLRSDATDTMNASSTDTLLTIDQDGSGDVLNIFSGSTEYFSVLSGGNVGINNANPGNQLSVGGDLGITTDQADLRFYQGSNYVGFQASSSLSGNQIWTLPAVDGGTNQVLATDGAGNLAWINGSAATGTVSTYLALTDTPGTFTTSAIPFTNTGGDALLHSSGFTFTDTNDILTVGTQQLYGYGTNNLFLGASTGNTSLSGSQNVAVGGGSGSALATGSENAFFGYGAGANVSSGTANAFFGTNAGNGATSTSNNTFLGYNAGASNTANGIVAIGYNAGAGNTKRSLTAIGYNAGFVNEGNYNTFIGESSGASNSTGGGNTFIGEHSGRANTTGARNTFIGALCTGAGNVGGDYNVFIGDCTGYGNNEGLRNLYMGSSVSYYREGDDNLMFGYGSGSGPLGTSGDRNLFMGTYSGNSTDADDNIFLGYYSGYDNTSGTLNLFIGNQSGVNNITGNSNLFLGYQSGFTNTAGSNNLFLGYQAGYSETGSNKLYLDNSSSTTPLIYGEFDNDLVTINGTLNLGGSNNELRFYEGSNYVGFEAPALSGNQIWVLPDTDATSSGQVLASDATGNLFWTTASGGGASDYLSLTDTPGTFTTSAIPFTNTGGDALLHSSGFTFTDTNDILTVGTQQLYGYGTNNLFLGESAGNTSLSGATNNTAVGYRAGVAISGGDWNTFLGSSAGESITGGSRNLFLGYQAGNTATTSDDNTFLGYQAGLSNTTGAYNVYIGSGAGDVNTTGAANVFIGVNAGGANTTASLNTFIGRNAGLSNTTGSSNTFVGYIAGTSNSTGTENTFLGVSAGGLNIGGSYNTFVGKSAGYNNTSGSNNAYFGWEAGLLGTTGGANTFIGRYAGRANTIASDNTFLGTSAGSVNTTGGSNTFIGRNAGLSNTTSGNNVFLGKDAGYSATGASNVFLGYQAGYSETGSNKLYIENSNSASPLIHGDFLADTIRFNATTTVNAPNADGGAVAVGKALTITGAAGNYGLDSIFINKLGSSPANYSNIRVQVNDIDTTRIRSMRSDGSTRIESYNGTSAYNTGQLTLLPNGSVLVGTTTTSTLFAVEGDASILGSNNELRFYEGSNYVGFEAPALSGNQIWVLPDTDATSSGQVLASDATGNLFWTTASGGGASDYLSLTDTPGTFTTSAIPFTNTGGDALLHSSGFTFTDTDDILTVGLSRIWDDGGTSVFVGQSAGNTSASGNNNVMIGQNGGAALTSGGNNVSLGAGAGSALTSGGNNVLLGYQAGNTLTTGGTNILIGYDVDVSSNSSSNQLNIGNLIYGNLGATQLSIGTSTLSHTLAVAGSFDVNSGAINYSTTTNITSIERLDLGNIEFEDNAGAVSWIDMKVTASSSSGTIMSYVAQIDTQEILKLYAEADGAGGINTTRVVIGTSTNAILGSSNIPDGSLIITDGILCVDDGAGGANCDDVARTPGQIYAESSSVTAIDLAENFPTKDASLEAGELVMVDPDNPVFVKTYDPADPEAVLIGVVSTKPGVLLGGFGDERYKGERKVPVALAGRVPVRVTTEAGAISVGDRLSFASTPGFAKRADVYESTIGIALESVDEGAVEGQEILVFINLQSVQEASGSGGGLLATLRSYGVELSKQITKITKLAVATFTVGTAEHPTGITIYDTVTRQPYCIVITNGMQVATSGACPDVDTSGFVPQSGIVAGTSTTPTPAPQPAPESSPEPTTPEPTPSPTNTTPTSTTPVATSTNSGATSAPSSGVSSTSTTPTPAPQPAPESSPEPTTPEPTPSPTNTTPTSTTPVATSTNSGATSAPSSGVSSTSTTS